MANGWIVELTMPAENGTRSSRRYCVRCTHHPEAKQAVLSYASADAGTQVFFIRPMTDDELAKRQLKDGEVVAWD